MFFIVNLLFFKLLLSYLIFVCSIRFIGLVLFWELYLERMPIKRCLQKNKYATKNSFVIDEKSFNVLLHSNVI